VAVIAVLSAKGSPGATTLALGLALARPRPTVLVEADASGASAVLAGYLRATRRHDRGLIDVALANSLGESLPDALQAALMPLPDSDVRLLPGIANATQAASLSDLWSPFGSELRRLDDTDVIIDVGRLGAQHGAEPLLASADLILLALRSDLPAIAATRGRLPLLRADLERLGSGADALRSVVIGPDRPYATKEIEAAIDLPVLGEVAWDPRGAAVLSHGANGRRSWHGGRLNRSLAALITSTEQVLADRTAPVVEARP
jgi:MinD-like ATPase involved in chromosome partitioning or flagellar assembly